jgi:hypothetical protein
MNVLGDTWDWDGVRWTRRAQSGPEPRVHFAMGFDAKRRAVVLYGGAAEHGPLGDTWLWSGTEWRRLEDGRPKLADGMAQDPQTGRALLVGSVDEAPAGDGSSRAMLWMLEADGHWSQRAPPGPLFSAVAPVSRTLKGLLVFAGWESDRRVQVHAWNGQEWATTAPAEPPARRGAAATFDSGREVVVLYGGENTTGILADTWEWDGTRWTKHRGL